MAESIPPLRVLQTGGINQIPVFELELSGGTLTRSSATRVKYEPPGAGTGAPVAGEYVTYAANATLTAERTLSAGTSIAVTTNLTQIFISASDKTIRLPLALLTVQPDSANAFWTAVTGTNVDMAHVSFLDGGEGIATWYGIVPFNVSSTPLWNLDIYSVAGTSTIAGSAVYSIRGKSLASGEDLDAATYTTLVSSQISSIFRSNTLTISAASGGNLDTVVAVSASDYLFLEVNRHGGHASDTIGDFWNIKSVVMRVNIL